MSYEAVAAIMDSDIRPPSLKLTAVAMGNFLNAKTGQLNPSMGQIARACGLSSVQARRQVHELIGMGVLSVVGNHDGGNAGASRRYQLHLDCLPMTPITGDSPTTLADETPITDERPITDESDPSHGREVPLSLVSDTPLTGESQTKKEPGRNLEKNQEKRKRSPGVACPSDVDQQTWDDYMTVRKAKRAPMTATALKLLNGEATKAGLSLQAAVSICCERSWASLKADWLLGDGSGSRGRESFAQGDDRRARERVADFMGRRPASTVRRTGFEDIDYTEGVKDHGHLV
jgi:hypothetical protein